MKPILFSLFSLLVVFSAAPAFAAGAYVCTAIASVSPPMRPAIPVLATGATLAEAQKNALNACVGSSGGFAAGCQIQSCSKK